MILVTGAAGFIGYTICKKLLEENISVIGIDNINTYYDPELKRARLENLKKFKNFTFRLIDIADEIGVGSIFKKYTPEKVVNLAAQVGVKYSIINPEQYIRSNILGFLNIINNCKVYEIKHLIYASSSSVYGINSKLPFSIDQQTEFPISFYAVSKKTNELMAHA